VAATTPTQSSSRPPPPPPDPLRLMERGVSTHALSAEEGDRDEVGSDEDMGYEDNYCS
jgi:hypothetical protein